MDNPKDLTPILITVIYFVICEYGYASCDLLTTFSDILDIFLYIFPIFFKTECNFLASVIKWMLYKLCVCLFQRRQNCQFKSIIHMWCCCMCMWLILGSPLAACRPSYLMVLLTLQIKKTKQLLIGQDMCPNLTTATFGFQILTRKFGELLIAIRIRTAPAQTIHINNWNKTLHCTSN